MVTLISSTMILGYSLKIFEEPMDFVSGHDFTDFYACMYNVVITVTSAGYGEIYPKSFFGRIVGVLICFWGVFIVSTFVIIVTSLLEFTLSQI